MIVVAYDIDAEVGSASGDAVADVDEIARIAAVRMGYDNQVLSDVTAIRYTPGT